MRTTATLRLGAVQFPHAQTIGTSRHSASKPRNVYANSHCRLVYAQDGIDQHCRWGLEVAEHSSAQRTEELADDLQRTYPTISALERHRGLLALRHYCKHCVRLVTGRCARGNPAPPAASAMRHKRLA